MKTLEFKGLGKFTVRGLTVGENIRVRNKVREKRGYMDEDEVGVELLHLAIVESPEKSNPPEIYIKGLKFGVGQRLLMEMAKLSNVDLVEEKNLETPSEEKKQTN